MRICSTNIVSAQSQKVFFNSISHTYHETAQKTINVQNIQVKQVSIFQTKEDKE